MRTNPNCLAVIQDNNLVGVLNRRSTLRNQKNRGRIRQLANGFAQSGVRREIERGGAVVKNQTTRTTHQSACDGDARASQSSSSVASGFPHFRFSRTVPWKRTAFCGTTPIMERSSSSG